MWPNRQFRVERNHEETLKKPFTENFSFCAVLVTCLWSGKKPNPSDSANYLDVEIHKHLTLKEYNDGISINLIKKM